MLSNSITSRTTAIAIAAMVLLFPTPHALAVTFTVNDTADAPDVDSDDGRCETAAGAGDCTLRAAIQQANASTEADEILLPGGLYSLTLADAPEDAAASGDLDVTADLTLRGAGAQTTIINAGRIDRVFEVDPTRAGEVDVEISGVAIQNGSNGLGGGVANNGTLVLTDVALTGSLAAAGDGGGVFNRGTLTLRNTLVSDNSATADGGGLLNAGTLIMINSTVSGNMGGNAGGIDNRGPLTVTASTIAANRGDGAGGVLNRTVAADVMIGSTIVSGNLGGNCSAALTSTGHNLEDTNTCGFSAPTDRRDTDPQLCPLDDFGGPTMTHALPASSPALDTGPPNGCPATDQRGLARPRDGDGDATPVCDIGAFEAQDAATSCDIVTPSPTTPSPTPTPTPTLASATPTATVSSCPGDCDGSGDVDVSELIRGVNIALGNAGTATCRAFDRNQTGTVTVDELVVAVNAALQGCAQGDSPTPVVALRAPPPRRPPGHRSR